VRPISDDDHVFGSRDADVFLIEYSDYQCPFCERFHTTVKEALKQYDGKVAWVYRHLPLDGLHPEARPAAIASECVAQLGGNDAFWDFTDKIFEDQRAMGAARYRAIVGELGLDQAAFDACVADGSVEDRVNADSDNAQELGGNGTPFNVLLTKNGKSRNFSGALPLANVKVLIDSALRSAQQ
jgi:protein-disulfide isomerase